MPDNRITDNRIISLSEPDLYDYLCWSVWRDKPHCPKCGACKIVKRSFKNYYCTGCRHNFSPRSLTPFKGTRIFLKNWILYVYLYLDNPGMSACDFKAWAKIKYRRQADDIVNRLSDILKRPEHRLFFYKVSADFDQYLRYLNEAGRPISCGHVLIYKKRDIKEDIKEYRLKAGVLEKRREAAAGRRIYFLIIQINGYRLECMINRKNWRLIPRIEGREFVFLCTVVFTHKNIRVLIKNYKTICSKDVIDNDDFFDLCGYYDIDLGGGKHE